MLRGFVPPFTKGLTRRQTPGSTTLVTPSAPATPSTPSPTDTAAAYYTRLSWVSARATNADVYLSTVNPPTTIVGIKLQTTTYIPTLLPATTYYWKVVAFNAGGSATGPVWSFTTPAATATLFELAGSVLTSTDRARFPSLNIHDVIGSEPNTGSVTFGSAQTSGTAVRIGLGTLDDDRLIFGGETQSVDQSYEGVPDRNPLWNASLIDHTFRLNKRRPFGTWVDTSASVIARYLVAAFAPGFTSDGVKDGLPAISINFDGSEDFMTCMRRLATAISDLVTVGKTTVDYNRDVTLFLVDTDDESPDPIDPDHPPLDKPSPITFSIDHSQIRTEVFGKGHGESVPLDLLAGQTIIPLPNTSMFNVDGGMVIVSTTADGAQTTILTYDGVQLGGGGSLVGPGAAPSAAPSATASVGIGLNAGVYQYAYTDVTASGESIASPVGTVTTGTVLDPPAAPVDNGYGNGGNLTTGDYLYAVTLTNASGETTHGPAISVHVDTSFLGAPPAQVTVLLPLGPSGTTSRKLYRSVVNGSQLKLAATIADNTTVFFNDPLADGSLGVNVPTINTALNNQVTVTGIAVGPSTTTSRKLYRTVVNGSQLKLLTTLADNVTTTYTDATTDGSLGANVTTTDTSGLTLPSGQVSPGSIALVVSNVSPFQSSGGWVTLVGGQTVRYTAIGGGFAPPVGVSGAASAGGSMTPGVHGFALTCISAVGESLPGPITFFTTGGANNQVSLTCPVGPSGTIDRGFYVTTANSTVLHRNGSIGDNSTTSVTSMAADSVFVSGSAPPAIDTSALDPRNYLLGIPASGPGSIATAVLYGSPVTPAPSLTGINSWNGIPLAMAKGSSVNILVRRVDLDAQAALGATELDENGHATDGVRQYMITDERRGEESLIALCDADLAQFSRPIVSCNYYTRDIKTKAGRTVSIDLSMGYDNTVLGDGAAEYWRLNDAVASATATDSGAGAHTGTVNGTVTFGQPALLRDGDTSALFDGTTGYITATVPAVGTSFTFEVWFKTTFSQEHHLVATTPSFFYIQNGPHTVKFDGGAGTRLDSGIEVVDGIPHHAVVTYDGVTGRLYLDGAQVDSGAKTWNLTGTTAYIGRYSGGGAFLMGTLGKVGIYGRALSAAEVAAHYALRTSGFAFGAYGEAGDFTIQSVDLTFDAPSLYPLRRVMASSTAFTLTDLLRRVSVT